MHLENGVKIISQPQSNTDMDIENTNVNTENSSLAIPLTPVPPLSPTVKVFSSLPINSFQADGDKSEEEGLIEGGESDDEKKKSELELSERKPVKPVYYSSEKSSSRYVIFDPLDLDQETKDDKDHTRSRSEAPLKEDEGATAQASSTSTIASIHN